MSELVSVLVDGDNLSGRHAERILEISEKFGRLNVCRVYADAQRSSEWHEANGYRFIHAGAGKNAADILLALDAMELLLTRQMRCFVVASSDGDFRHLATRLREHGAVVVGVGEGKAPESYRASCTEFMEIGLPSAVGQQTSAIISVSKLDLLIRAMVAQHSRQGAGMKIADLAPKMHSLHGIRISTYPERSWRAYLASRPSLYDLDPRGPDAMVRFRPDGFLDRT